MRAMSEEVLERVAEYNVAYQREFGKAPSFRQIMHAGARVACDGAEVC